MPTTGSVNYGAASCLSEINGGPKNRRSHQLDLLTFM
jgi:hypothetical protein